MTVRIPSDRVQIWDRTRTAHVDPAYYLVTIEIEHHKVHEGEIFFASDDATGVNIATPKFYLLTTPDANITGKHIHFAYTLNVNRSAKFEIWEDSFINASGTLLNIGNADRNSTKVNYVEIYKDATVNASGSRIAVFHVGSAASGLGANAVTGGGGADSKLPELILKSDTKYIFKISPKEDDLDMSIGFGYYQQDVFE